MGYEIEKQDGFYEVRLSGNGTKATIFKAVFELMRKDPRKRYPDLWVVSPEFQIPYVEYGGIVSVLSYVFTPLLISRKSAFVSLGCDFQRAQLEIYRQEVATRLQVDARVFNTREEAIAWFSAPVGGEG